jgi:hypothetical protein
MASAEKFENRPLGPSNLLAIVYAATAVWLFSVHFGTLGTTEGNSKPKPHCSAHFLRRFLVNQVGGSAFFVR